MPQPGDEYKRAQVAAMHSQLQQEGTWDTAKHDEFALIRFLNPKDYRIPEAKAAWNAWLQWRADWHVDDILEVEVLDQKSMERFLEVFPHGLHGVDKKGQPVLIYRLGKTKFSQLLAMFPETVRQKMHVQLYEFIMRVALPACSLAAGKRIDRVTTIYDLEGVTMLSASSCATVLTSTTKILGLYYPETLAHLLLVNAPGYVDSVFSASRSMLAPATQQKIQVFSKAATKAELAKLIPVDQLPVFLGGTSKEFLSRAFGPWEHLPSAAPNPSSTTAEQRSSDTAGAGAKAAAEAPAQPKVDGALTSVVANGGHLHGAAAAAPALGLGDSDGRTGLAGTAGADVAVVTATAEPAVAAAGSSAGTDASDVQLQATGAADGGTETSGLPHARPDTGTGAGTDAVQTEGRVTKEGEEADRPQPLGMEALGEGDDRPTPLNMEVFQSCIDNNFVVDVRGLGGAISDAESRFLSRYMSASWRYVAPSFRHVTDADDETVRPTAVEIIPEEAHPHTHGAGQHGGIGSGAGGLAGRGSGTWGYGMGGTPQGGQKPSTKELASRCCVIM